MNAWRTEDEALGAGVTRDAVRVGSSHTPRATTKTITAKRMSSGARTRREAGNIDFTEPINVSSWEVLELHPWRLRKPFWETRIDHQTTSVATPVEIRNMSVRVFQSVGCSNTGTNPIAINHDQRCAKRSRNERWWWGLGFSRAVSSQSATQTIAGVMRQTKITFRSEFGILFVPTNSVIRDHNQRVLSAKPTEAPCAASNADARTSLVSAGRLASMLLPAMFRSAQTCDDRSVLLCRMA